MTPPRLRFSAAAAYRHLRAADPVLAAIIEAHGPFRLRPAMDHYESLLRTILFQQLAGAAARTIQRRWLALYGDGPAGGEGRYPTPEELLAAAHAVCFAMVLTNTIGKQGGKAGKVRVTATVTADKGDAGIKVTSSHLTATVDGLEGIEKGKLQELAVGAEKGCPISNAIRGSVSITVAATAS